MHEKAPWVLIRIMMRLTAVWIGDVSFLMRKRLKTVVFFIIKIKRNKKYKTKQKKTEQKPNNRAEHSKLEPDYFIFTLFLRYNRCLLKETF